jgi:hypothetical protein
MALLHSGDFARGWPAYEARLEDRKYLKEFPRPRLDVNEDLRGQRVLLLHEQGYGDSIQMLRYVPRLQALGATVLYGCPPALAPLAASIKGLGVLPNERYQPDVGESHVTYQFPAFDAWCPVMSLPLAFGTELDTIPDGVPYLAAQAELVDSVRRFLPRSESSVPTSIAEISKRTTDNRQPTTDNLPRYVGINWQGNPKHENDRNRSIPLRTFAPLAAVPGVRLVSLQVAAGLEQLTEIDFPVWDFARYIKDFGHLAAVIEALDQVITCDSAVAHVAGALGKQVWVALPYHSDWRWLDGTNEFSPWYPTMGLVRQTSPGDWTAPFRTMADALTLSQAATS